MGKAQILHPTRQQRDCQEGEDAPSAFLGVILENWLGSTHWDRDQDIGLSPLRGCSDSPTRQAANSTVLTSQNKKSFQLVSLILVHASEKCPLCAVVLTFITQSVSPALADEMYSYKRGQLANHSNSPKDDLLWKIPPKEKCGLKKTS